MPQSAAVPTHPSDTIEARLKYLVKSDKKPTVYIGAPGQESIRTATYAFHTVAIRDGRPDAGDFALEREGFALRRQRTAVRDFYDDAEVKAVYYPEMERFVAAELGASKAHVFDHNTRISGQASKPGAELPVHAAHNDYTEKSGPQRVRDLLDADEAARWLAGHFAIVNVWRPIRGPIRTTPLAVGDAQSLAPGDLVGTDLVYEDRVGETYGLAFNPSHRWYYFPDMAADEALLIKGYDNLTDGRARFTPHTAFDDPTSPADAPPRESIEIRALVLY